MTRQDSAGFGGLAWKKSSYSGANGQCVEVATPSPTSIAVRDSKNPGGPALSFSAEAWSAFVADVTGGAFGNV
ncbi:DUF397 domain-containing protein [Streptomyces sp. SCUT-3]|nr:MULTISPECIES: DUF397 domain-containing protein [unclassified Streptomyces]MCZ2525990.1 DUF397 domain-containing protein [Streptomyces sp. HB2AG]PLW71871.1 DUF397 domain-containing protein [Streptomyces sp. DJ]QMV25131.1 DUF397 domain-containing protein [Streptomyces sp. SCUT-3]